MAEALHSSRTGDLLNGVYELHEPLAASAEHDTYRATDTRRGTGVQITLLKAELALRAGAVERFLELPRKLAGLRHAHVAQTLGIELDETGIPFVVQEDVQGEPLAKTLAGFAQGMPLGVAVAVLAPVVDAVAAAHALGLVHGRLSREQILLVRIGGSSLPKLTGFGRAPEGADQSSDVWALGALLYEALGGESVSRPGKPHTPLDELAPHLPAELVTLVERCLLRDPSARPADAVAVRDALAKVTDSMRTGERNPAAAPPRRLHAGEAATDPVEPPKPAVSAVAATVADTTPFGFDSKLAVDATMAAPVSVAALHAAIAARSVPQPSEDGFELAGEQDEDDDQPELSFEVPSPSMPPKTVAGRRSKRPQAAEPKTASDLAAAFAPMEGADLIGQSETAESALVRGFKQSFDEGQAAAAKQRRFGRAAAVAVAANAADSQRPAASGALKSRKELRDGTPKPVARTLSDEKLLHIRRVADDNEQKDDGVVGMLLFFLFVVLLPFATPILCDPEHAQVPKLLVGHEKLAAGAFGVLTTIALVRTWALQIHASPALLRPVTTTLKLVTAAVCILCVGWFLPAGALGPVQRYARIGLPWGASGFYVFLALHGLARAVREAGQGAIRAVGMTALYLSAFFGSYRVLSTTVMDAKYKTAMRAKASKSSVTGVTRVDDLLAASAVEVPDAGIAPEAPMQQRTEVGASEADDMAAIEALGKGSQAKGKQLGEFSKKIGKVMR